MFCPKSPVFTPEFKTFIFMLFQNGRNRWIAQGKYLRLHPEAIRVPKKPTKAEREAHTGAQPLDMTMYEAEFTNNESGQVFNGWADALPMYNETLTKIRDQHDNNMAKIIETEKKFLPMLQKHVQAESEKDNDGRPRKRIKIVKAVVVPSLYEFSDDEDDSSDGEGDFGEEEEETEE